LQGACDNGVFAIPPLTSGESYVGPSGSDDASDRCKCNTVVYSLMSACDACQSEQAIWFPWKTWATNCSAVDPPSTFSNTIPNGTMVPAWAFLDVTNTGTWNPVLSYQVGDRPEVSSGKSGTLSHQPTPTTTQTSVPGLSSSQAQFASKGNHHSNHTAAIVGGVLGGIVFIALTIVLMLWGQRVRRRRATRTAATFILGNNAVPLQEKMSKRKPPPDVVPSAI